MVNLLLSIQRIQERLSDAGILSIVIGGIAVAAWGEPRTTRDVDLKVLLSREDSHVLLDLLISGYTSLVASPEQTLRKQGLIFIQDDLGTRLDLLLADTPYDQLAIKRGQNVEIQKGMTIRVCSPEDLIIYKLISTRLRDHEDAGSVIHRQDEKLDDGYVVDWLKQFEHALDDSTLVEEYKRIRKASR